MNKIIPDNNDFANRLGSFYDAVESYFDITERVVNGQLSPAEARWMVRNLRRTTAAQSPAAKGPAR